MFNFTKRELVYLAVSLAVAGVLGLAGSIYAANAYIVASHSSDPLQGKPTLIVRGGKIVTY